MDNTEELIPLLLPDDEEGYSWSLRYVTKEEADKTIAMNLDNYCSDSMSREIISTNRQCVVDMGYGEELRDYSEEFSFAEKVPTLLFVLIVAIVIAVVGAAFIAWINE